MVTHASPSLISENENGQASTRNKLGVSAEAYG